MTNMSNLEVCKAAEKHAELMVLNIINRNPKLAGKSRAWVAGFTWGFCVAHSVGDIPTAPVHKGHG